MPLILKKFDIEENKDKVIIYIGKRNVGISYLTKDLDPKRAS
jgi:hypothetical protein